MSPRLLALALTCCAVPAAASGLLDRKPPTRVERVAPHPALTDGHAVPDGSDWQAPGAVVVPRDALLEWDLGSVQPIIGAAIQADNNDAYDLLGSEDGKTFRLLWRAPAVPEAGLQTRRTTDLRALARWLRLAPQGGDGNFSVAEFEVFATKADAARSSLLLPLWLPSNPLDLAWTVALLVTALVLLIAGRDSPRLVVWTGAAVLLGAGAVMVKLAVVDPPSVVPQRLNYLRAAVAGLAALVVLREAVLRRRHPAHRGLGLGVLAFTAALGLLCFGNLGRPQFHDVGKRQPTFLHYYDMRTYYPIARYFPEVRFDGVYAASAMAVAQDRGGVDAIAGVGLRDLRTHVPTTAGEARDHLAAVRARFSPERWQSFTDDMRYFRAAMGDGGFLGSMSDHGGNATPVWFLGARALFGGMKASDTALWVGVAADVLLLLLAFASLWWAFGARTAFIGATVFGAMDFYMFGSNWFGAALRHDWLALWCLGLAALRKERFRLAGALLAWAALIRAFPALTFLTLTVPVAWQAVVALKQRRFKLREWLSANAGYWNVALGAAVGGGVLVLLSIAVFGASAWPEWLRKVSLLDSAGHVNNLAVKTWVVARGPGLWAIQALTVALVIAAVRKAPLEEAAAVGVVLLPVVFNPANYYLHSVFLLVVLAGERDGAVGWRGLATWAALLLMCFASFFTTQHPDIGRHFKQDTWVMLAALFAVTATAIAASFRAAPVSALQPAPAAGTTEAPCPSPSTSSTTS